MVRLLFLIHGVFMVALVSASARGIENHERARRALENLPWSDTLEVTFHSFGMGIYENAVTRGYTKILALCEAASWQHFIADCDARFSCHAVDEDRSECRFWRTTLFDNEPIELLAARRDSPVAARIMARMEALKDPSTRRRYLIAKAHGAERDERVYQMVKSLFWETHEDPAPKWEQPIQPILKLLRAHEWESLVRDEETQGAPIDIQDGFVHFSTPGQVAETFQKYFADQKRVWLITLDAAALGPSLRFEPSRNDDLFPHLYGPLRLADVHLVRPWNGDGFDTTKNADTRK